MRSLLLVSADSDAALRQAAASGADALIVGFAGADLAARERVASFLRAPRPSPVYLRIGPVTAGQMGADLDAAMPLRPDGIVLSDAEGGADVTRLSAMLRPREARAGLADGATRILAMAAGTPAAVLALGSYRGASARLAGLIWDPNGLVASLGADVTSEPVRLSRGLLAIGAAAAGVAAIDQLSSDDSRMEAEAEAARREGFAAKLAVRPGQAAVLNRIFSRARSSA